MPVVAGAASSPVVGSSAARPVFGGVFQPTSSTAQPDCQAGFHDYNAVASVPMSSRLVCNDDDGDVLTYAAVTQPAHGTLTVNPDGTFTYTAVAGFVGTDTFDFSASDPTDPTPSSDTGTATIDVVASTPDPATNLTATAVSTTEIDLTWDPGANATSYAVLRSTTSGGPYSSVGTTADTTFADTGAAPGTKYFYVVRGGNGNGNAADSNEASATTQLAAPTALTATAASSSEIDLTWTASAGAAGYQVLRSSTSGGPYTPVGTPATSSFADTGLSPGQRYYYVVTASTADAVSPQSNEASAATLLDAPTGLTATPISTTRIDLTWTASTAASSYVVARATTSGGPYTQVGTPATTSFSDTGLSPGKKYFYVVHAVNAVSSSPNSAEASATTLLAAPTGLTATTFSTARIDLAWTAPTGATSYRVLRGTTSGGPYTQVGSPSATAFSDIGLAPGTRYFYVVVAVTADAVSPASNEATALTLLAAPTGLTATPISTTRIDLSWTAPAGSIHNYSVLRGTTPGGPYVEVGTPGAASFSDTTGLTPGTTYFYVVRAVSNDGAVSPSSTEAHATTLLAPPANLTATAVSRTEIDLAWDASPGATGYRIFRGTSSGGETFLTTAASTSLSDTSLAPHTTYYYYVEATSPAATSSPSNEAHDRTQNGAPTAVADSYSVAGNTPLTKNAAQGVLHNDTDPDLDHLTATKISDPMNGIVSLNADGGFTYTPHHDYVGPDSFKYEVSDGFGGTDQATVTFDVTQPAKFALTVSRAGTGTGLVTSSPAGINCGVDCTETYTKDTQVTLTAAPASNAVFAGWSGGCAGTEPTCVVTMDGVKNVTATFVKQHWDLKVTKSGGGGGTVASVPAGINCGATCTAAYDDGTVVTLTATPDASSEFTGWSGACSGTSNVCTLTMSGSANAVAQFKAKKTPPPKVGLSVVGGPVSGNVTYKLPGTNSFVPLTGDTQLPNGTIVNTKNGVLKVQSAEGNGTIDTAEIWAGIVRINTYVYKPLGLFGLGATTKKLYGTQFTLVEKLDCRTAGLQTTKKRRLWGSGKGKFRTKGQFSSATVRGTKWLVEDSCTSTLTKVARGIVEVQDFVKKKLVLVKAGHSYVASAKPPAKKKKR